MIGLTKNIIIDYIKNNFDETDFIVKENEIQLNSPFKNDTKYHLGISLKPDNLGVWNDFKPPQMSGNFLKFVALHKNISIDEAKREIIYKYLKNDISKIKEIEEKNNDDYKEEEIYNYKKIKLPPFSTLILKNGEPTSLYAKSFLHFLLRKRNLDLETIEKKKLMYSYKGEYMGFLIIPFYNDKEEVVYWTARNVLKLISYDKKYKNISSRITKGKGGGIGYNIFTDEKKIVLVEGTFDALRLPENAIALLSNDISKNQIKMLFKKDREEIIVAMDNYKKDKAGYYSINKILKKIYEYMIENNITDTKLKMFLWNDEFSKCKDFSRCEFKIKLNNIIKNSIEYNYENKYKTNLLVKLSPLSEF